LALTQTAQNDTIRPCAFRKDGIPRKIKDATLLSRIKKLCFLKESSLKIAVCITMYNEEENEFKTTM
jgi:hypothetical protein